MLTASRVLVAVAARSLAAVEDTVTLPQFRLMVALAGHEPLTLTAIAEQLSVNPSTAMRMVDRLAAAGRSGLVAALRAFTAASGEPDAPAAELARLGWA